MCRLVVRPQAHRLGSPIAFRTLITRTENKIRAFVDCGQSNINHETRTTNQKPPPNRKTIPTNQSTPYCNKPVHTTARNIATCRTARNECGPAHIVIGDGGNREGLASKYMDPKPEISMFREASFGHGELEVVNETHALWTWHRNDNDESVVADSAWLTSLASNPACTKS
uniref:Purple acid phosphatase C-terminal domain-containing protein n=1 Tax=Kalanchoe fedtschenkoi TaxID=63787 RepID=A0A7N0ZUM6_KALFE